ncbi:MAG: pyridoxamine 5'-phosphate oxidase family protein [Bacteroidia bacterium]|nr:pyridoxamine 5'-phosphate oxidase family protein [Bacteroidia bacterium]
MTKEEIFAIINGMEHPVMYVATVENGNPHVRGILLYKTDENGIVFHTGKSKELYHQLTANPNAEVCFVSGKYQIRVEGQFQLLNDINYKREIVAHPSRKFLQGWIKEMGEEQFFDFLQVFKMEHGKAHVWTFEDNFAPKSFVTL